MTNQILSSLKINEDFAYLCGVLAGDGNIHIRLHKHDYAIKCVGNPKDEKDFYNTVIRDIFWKHVGIKIRPKLCDKGTTYGFVLNSKSLVLFLTEIIGLPKGRKDNLEIPKAFQTNKNLLKSFIQGFFDTDGCLSLKRRYRDYQYYPVVSCVSKSERIIDQIFEFLKSEDFRVHKGKRSYYDRRINKAPITYMVSMDGNLQLLKWMNFIGFRHPKHLKKFDSWKEVNRKIIAEGGLSQAF